MKTKSGCTLLYNKIKFHAHTRKKEKNTDSLFMSNSSQDAIFLQSDNIYSLNDIFV